MFFGANVNPFRHPFLANAVLPLRWLLSVMPETPPAPMREHQISSCLADCKLYLSRIVILLHTPTLGAFYEAFEPGVARSLVRRLEIIPTPKHGSWRNVAENDLSSLTVLCVRHRRFGTFEELRATVCNEKLKGIQWHFNVEKARAKLKSLYPIIE